MIRKLFLVTLGICVLLMGASFLLAVRLADIASWSFSKAVPGAVLHLEHLRMVSLHHLVAGRLVITSKESGEELLRMDGGTATFSFQGLLKLKIPEVRLIQPTLVVSPRLIRLFSTPEGKETQPGNSKPFPVGLLRLVCEDGTLHVKDMGDKVPDLQAKFSFDLRDLSFGPSQVQQSIIFWAISAKKARSVGPPFLELDRMEVTFTFDQLMHSHLERVRIQGGKLAVGKQLRSLIGNSPPQPVAAQATSPKATPLPAWTVGRLNVFRVAVVLEGNDPSMSQTYFQLTTILKDVTLGTAASNLGSTLQTVQLSNIALRAPQPSGREVITLKTVFIRFTLQNLLRQQIDEVVVLYPTIYLSEDLFAYMDAASAKKGKTPPSASAHAAAPTTQSPTAGWVIRRVRVDFGNLVLGGSAGQNVGLPVKFQTDIRDIALDNLAALKINAELQIPAEDYRFASYQLEFGSKSGEMRFAYPAEKRTNNVVTVLKLSHLRWRQYRFQEPWVGVTFDSKGVNGKFGAKAYNGYLLGGFSFLFGAGSPWSGWLGGRKINLSELTKIISPENFSMTGPLDLVVQVNAHGTYIDRLKGDFRVGVPGNMRIGKIDNILKELPKEWSPLQRSATTIALETLRDFEYNKAVGNFWFVDSQGVLDLNLTGPTGSRKFKVLLHTNNRSSAVWESSAAVTSQ